LTTPAIGNIVWLEVKIRELQRRWSKEEKASVISEGG
jgi:hypothetical protein